MRRNFREWMHNIFYYPDPSLAQYGRSEGGGLVSVPRSEHSVERYARQGTI